MWHELYGKPPPAFSRSYLISRLAYRIQELAYGGLKPATRAKLDALADGLDPKAARKRVAGAADRRHPALPRLAGHRAHRHGARTTASTGRAGATRACRAVARAITGTRWNGPLFFGLAEGRQVSQRPARKLPLRGLHPQVLRGGPGAGVQLPPRPARGRARLHRQPERRGLDRAARPLRRRRHLGRHAGAAGPAAPAARHRGRADRRRRGLQDRPASAAR